MMRRAIALFAALLMLAPILALAEEAPLIEGPVLVSQVPADVLFVENSVTEDGGYTERLETLDGYANIVFLRLAGQFAAEELLLELYPGAMDVTEVDQPPIAGYPAVRRMFTTGENEDTRFGSLVVFSTDAYTFAFAVDVWADAYEAYGELVEWWIDALDLFDPAEVAVFE